MRAKVVHLFHNTKKKESLATFSQKTFCRKKSFTYFCSRKNKNYPKATMDDYHAENMNE